MNSHRAILVGLLLIAAFVALFVLFDGAIGGQEERVGTVVPEGPFAASPDLEGQDEARNRRDAVARREERQDIETLHLNQGNDALQSLLVHVKHANGKPAAGIPIELISRRWWSSREQWIWPETKGRALSDMWGMAIFPEARWHAERLFEERKLFLRVDALLREPLELTWDATSDEPVVIVLPELATMRVRCRDVHDDAIEPLPAMEVLAWDARVEHPESGQVLKGAFNVRRRERGTLLLSPGMKLHFRVDAPEYPIEERTHRVRGPTVAGEILDVDLCLGARLPVLTGLVQTANALALCDAPLTYRLYLPGYEQDVAFEAVSLDERSAVDSNEHPLAEEHPLWSDVRTGTLRTDGEGRFRFAVDGLSPEGWKGDGRLDLFLGEASSDAHVPPTDRASVSIASLPSEVTQDFGVLELRSQPVLVAGRVVDEAGNPIASAKVVVHIPTAERMEVEGSSVVFEGSTLVRRRSAESFRGSTDASGNFLIRGTTRDGVQPSLDVSAAGFLPTVFDTPGGTRRAPVFTPGQRDVLVRLQRSAALQVSFHWPSRDYEESPPLVEVSVAYADGLVVTERPKPPYWSRSGSRSVHLRGVRIQGLPTGFATVTVVAIRENHLGEPMRHVVYDVELLAGGTSLDPRLNPLDLMTGHRRWQLTFERQDGKALARGEIEVEVGGRRFADSTDARGACVLLLEEGVSTVRIRYQLGPWKDVAWGDGVILCRLPDGPRLAVRLPAGIVSYEDELDMQLEVRTPERSLEPVFLAEQANGSWRADVFMTPGQAVSWSVLVYGRYRRTIQGSIETPDEQVTLPMTGVLERQVPLTRARVLELLGK